MSLDIQIHNCPGTLAEGYDTYSNACLKKVFKGRKVYHILDYDSPSVNPLTKELFENSRKRISISGVQEKFSVILKKNKLRLIGEDERGTHILKPIPQIGKRLDQMPANEHLTMQIAKQVYKISTAENALIFFRNGDPAYITKRFDNNDNNDKLAQEDFASLTGKTPQTDGEHYKYLGNYLDLFNFMKDHVPAYKIESHKLFRILIFNYLFSNGDAHLKNFSLLETPMRDFRLSPSYDLLNSRIHIDDSDFALESGLLPNNLRNGKINSQFKLLAEQSNIKEKLSKYTLEFMMSQTERVKSLVKSSFLSEKTKNSYFQQYQKRLKRLSKE